MKPVEVLLVEDSAGDILMMRQALAHETFPVRVHTALDGAEAAQMLVEQHFTPDLVILDLNLPKVPGLLFLEGLDPRVPVVVFSSSSNPHDKQRALQLGARGYVVKPTDLDEYRRLVSQIIHNWAMGATASA